MDENRANGSLRDEIGLAIEASMAVEPAPELRAQVRARVDRERAQAGHWFRWQLASVGALVTVIAVVTFAPWQREATDSVPASEIAVVQMAPVVPFAAGVRPTPAPVERRAVRQRTMSAAVSNDAVLLRAYLDQVRQRRIDPSALSAVPPTEPLTLSAIGIEQIAIDPLPKLAAITGERQ